MKRGLAGIYGLLVLLIAACPTPGSSPGDVPIRTLVLHGADGAEGLRVDFFSGRAAWKTQQASESIAVDGPVVRIGSGTGGAEFGPDARGNAAGLRLRRGTTEAWRLTRIDGLLRVGDSAGIPLGRIVREGNTARLHGPGGELIVSATEEGGRVVVSKSDQTVVGFVSGSNDLERAALLYLKGLGDRERALILSAPQLP
ncbi:MAG: hypothetical protein SGI86_03380 [Deltaproteobacteria bacterium]|nr:hypothetical protein [Deltaproteobacteria bacterium]